MLFTNNIKKTLQFQRPTKNKNGDMEDCIFPKYQIKNTKQKEA